MKRIFAVLLACLGLYACKPGIPKDIIQPDKMEKVLFDIHVVDGYVNTMSATEDSTKKIAAAYYKGVYKKFEIDSALYNKSLNYYYQHADILKKMYENVATQLSKTKDKQLKAQAKETADSINKAKKQPKKAKDSVALPKKDSVAMPKKDPVAVPVKRPKAGQQVPVVPSNIPIPKKEHAISR